MASPPSPDIAFSAIYPQNTKNTPPSPSPLSSPPGELSAVRALSFLKFEFAHRPFSRPLYTFPPKPTFTLPEPEPDLTSSLLQPAPTRLHYTGPATLCFRSRPLLSGGWAGGRRREESERASERATLLYTSKGFPFFFSFFC